MNDTKNCPVCGAEFRENAGVQVDAGGRSITVCCDQCAKTAKAEPSKYSGQSPKSAQPTR